jgi:hypothetical protein
MLTRAPLNSQLSPMPTPSRPCTVPPSNVQELISLAVRGLVAMFDKDKQLFCHRLLRTEDGLVREGLSPRYTIMTLLGLRELELAGMDSPFDTQAIYASFIRDTNWIRGAGDLGLLIWLTASFDPDKLGGLFSTFDCETVLDRYSDAQEARTMELAWFLAGLAHAAETATKLISLLTDLSVETYHRIEENQGEYGLFGHMNTKNSLAGRLRGRVGSFADQVYPIYAMSKFAKIFQVEDPLGPALECANAVCGAQGESGQWWWLYDARSGRVFSRYPVYSVHQDGMAPMGLFAVEEATGQCFKQFIYKGLCWIYGTNELNVDMRDGTENLIWRCILPRNNQSKYWEMALNVVRSPNEHAQVRSLKILYEQRPYEFGWLLFALARNSVAETPLEGV